MLTQPAELAKAGVSEDRVRLEPIDDLIADIERALAAAG
jgi:O-acetylhomoserine/O-acetylserine sulfhydrylase-like pyridoxal-dependent enzyme